MAILFGPAFFMAKPSTRYKQIQQSKPLVWKWRVVKHGYPFWAMIYLGPPSDGQTLNKVQPDTAKQAFGLEMTYTKPKPIKNPP